MAEAPEVCCPRAAARLIPCLGCELVAVLRRTFPHSRVALAMPSPLESMTDEAQGKGGSSGALVFHHSISLALGCSWVRSG